MWFMNYIVTWLESVYGFFWDAYIEVLDWTYPFVFLSSPLYSLYYCFYYIAYYFGEFNVWLVWAAGRIDNILSTGDIWSYFEPWFTYASDAWSWVNNAAWNIWNEADNWWSNTSLTVQSWIDSAEDWLQLQINAVTNSLASLQSAWDSFSGRIPSIDAVLAWWSNWTVNLQVTIDTWWSGALLEVQGLIDSAFTVRASLWSGWQDWREKVADFFTDPEDWLYKSVDRIIERFW